MGVVTGTPNFYRNGDDLRDEIQEDIHSRMNMIMHEVTESSDEVIRSFEGWQAQVLTEILKMILDKIQLAKEKAMVS
jgi:hypothetical protein